MKIDMEVSKDKIDAVLQKEIKRLEKQVRSLETKIKGRESKIDKLSAELKKEMLRADEAEKILKCAELPKEFNTFLGLLNELMTAQIKSTEAESDYWRNQENKW